MTEPETYAVAWTYGQLNGWATIDYCDSIGGYEWDEFHVLRGPDGLLYIGSAGGCSCNSFSDESPADFVPVDNWQDAVKRLRAWAKEGYDRAGVALELESRLAASRPRKRIAHDPRRGFERRPYR